MDNIRGMVLFLPGLQLLIDLLCEKGWTVVGPTMPDGVREDTFVITLTCSDAAGDGFCVLTETGPAPGKGFDLTLTELLDEDGHRFFVEPGSDRGEDVLDELSTRAAGDEVLHAARADRDAARKIGEAAAQQMSRLPETDRVRVDEAPRV